MNNNKIIKLNNYEIANISGGDANDILQAKLMENLNTTQILNEFCNSTCGCERECSKSKTEAYDQGFEAGKNDSVSKGVLGVAIVFSVIIGVAMGR